MRIANNVSMINTYGNMKKANNRLQKNCEKLASGYRINRSADDAAGLAISEKMRAQINGLSQASDNISDGINYVQVADGALQEVQNIFLRIRELSVQASNDTYQGGDRQAIEEEIKQLKQEVSQIFNKTEFNNIKIWVQDTNVVVGHEKIDAIRVNVSSPNCTLDENNKHSIPVNNGIYSPDNDKYLLKADENGIVVSWKAYNGNEYESNTISWPADITGNHSFKLSDHLDLISNPELKGIDFTYSYNVSKYAELKDVIASIDGAKIHSYTGSSFYTKLFSHDEKPINGISFSASINYPAMLASEKDFEKYDTDFIESSVNKIKNTNNLIQNPTESDPSLKWQFEFEMPNIGTVKAESTYTYYICDWKDPDKKWWYEDKDINGNIIGRPSIPRYPDTDGANLDSVIDALNNDRGLSLLKDTNGTGGYIQVSFNLTAESSYKVNTGDSTSYSNVGSITMSIRVSGSDTVETINEKLANIKGLDIYAGNEATNELSSKSYTRANWYEEPWGIGQIDGAPIYEKKEEINLEIQAGANEEETISIDYTALTNTKVGINDISVLTREDANNAISLIDKASQIISEQRGIFGALQNRMEHAKSNVDNSHINTVDSESIIRDTNMAKEMAAYVKEQILMQANQSIMPQIRTMSESVLALLK
ncbi:flagellin [Sedimentibacter hydroxybenzoicus DSM 7310]|uniref:Flagellin n=1 Tax=Sedimentibacter hydroxybenzoicus DSM 7310 TaxID=1123245 RepID=A0A974BGR5_SEDHY|nr:flagellin [Sedimentibacter hydroxybenzoicus]NYB72631.1 flagellin [Sedimentibacter hydroxybenzoicus DSM 7310]